MRSKYVIFILCVILYVTVSGCLGDSTMGNKGPRSIEITNIALNSTIAVWNSSWYNSTIDNSSAHFTYINKIDENTTIVRLEFNTTDGKTHMSNISNHYNTNPVVIDIDGIPMS